MSESITRRAGDESKGLTLGELEQMVNHAKALGLGDEAVVHASVGWKSQVKAATITKRGPE